MKSLKILEEVERDTQITRHEGCPRPTGSELVGDRAAVFQERAGKGDGSKPEGFHMSSQSFPGLPWGCKGAQGNTWHIHDCRDQEDTEAQIFLYTTC